MRSGFQELQRRYALLEQEHSELVREAGRLRSSVSRLEAENKNLGDGAKRLQAQLRPAKRYLTVPEIREWLDAIKRGDWETVERLDEIQHGA